MTQQLTIEQLEFARSIGATYYDFDEHIFRRCGKRYESSKWRTGMKSHKYANYPCIQPIDFSPLDEYVPKVGEECEFNHPKFGWTGCTIIGPFRNRIVCAPNGGDFYDADASEYRPLPDPEQQRRDELLEKWRGRGVDYAHDTEQSLVPLSHVFHFIAELERKL